VHDDISAKPYDNCKIIMVNYADIDVSEDLSFESLFLKVAELENALCNQDKLLCQDFRENKKLNLELKNSCSEIASLRLVHNDISAKSCDNCKMIMVNYANLWLVHAQAASQLDGAKLELRELKTHSLLLGACTSCPLLKSDLEACSVEIKQLKHKLDHSSRYLWLVNAKVATQFDDVRLELRELKARSMLLGACTSCPLLRFDLEDLAIEIKDLKHKHDHSSRYTILSPPCEACVSLKGKLFHATKENTELKQEVPYLTPRLERTVVSEKMIEDDLSRVEESVTKSIYKLGAGFERCEDKGEKRAHKFVPTSNYHKEEETIKSIKTHYPSNPKPSSTPRKR
jgi:Fe-S cluster biogenesis protein NfuA